MPTILDTLKARGLYEDQTSPGLDAALQQPTTVYAGFDPSSESLQAGNFVAIMVLAHFQRAGHRVIALAGGATGLIGDPSFKTDERQLLTEEQVEKNLAGIQENLSRFLDFNHPTAPAKLVNNYDWFQGVTFISFLREIGKHFRMTQMLGKESVRARMEDREVGISYTEFSYMLLQAFDFYILRRDQNCELQIGGSDQWGNITAGIDLCRKKMGAYVYGLTLPLITNADGTKFGKSVAGAIWLNPHKTSVYRFYQFWIRTDDRDVIRYLRYFTFLSREEIAELEQKHTANPGAREAHKSLAKAVTDLIHGEAATAEAIRATEVLFGGDPAGISEVTFNDILGEAPTKEIERSKLADPGILLVDLLVHSGLCASKGQARKDLEGGGIYLNNMRETNPLRPVTLSNLLFGRHLLLRKGKKNYVAVTAKD